MKDTTCKSTMVWEGKNQQKKLHGIVIDQRYSLTTFLG